MTAMTYSYRPTPLELQDWNVQAAVLREQLQHAQAATLYWQRRYAEQERRANYFERQHSTADAQLSMYQQRERASK